MSKEQYESSVKQMPYSQSCVFAKLSDLSNMAVIKEKLDSLAPVTYNKLVYVY